MRASTKRIVSFFVSLGLFLACFVIYGGLLRPQYQSVNSLRGELASKTELFEQQEKVVAQVQELVMRYQGNAGLEETLSLALPRDQAIALLTHQLFTVAQNTGFAITSLGITEAPLKVGKALGGKQSQTKVGTLEISFNASGSYESLKAFLRAVETNIRVMDVQEVKMNPRDPRQIEYRITIATYYQVP